MTTENEYSSHIQRMLLNVIMDKVINL
jgi:hypothetical protein